MKIRCFWVVLFMLTAFSSYADEVRDVILQADRSQEVIRMGFVNVFVNRNDIDYDKCNVSVEIENLDETNLILFFGRSFSEKELSQLYPKIKYDKFFGATEGQRIIDPYTNSRNFILINPSDKSNIAEETLRIGDKSGVRLPMYIAKYKDNKQKNVILLQKVVLQLNYEVKIDEKFIRFNNAYDILVNELDTLKFCLNKRHPISLEEQKKTYLDKINEYIVEIDGVISSNNWSETDRNYQKYRGLRDKFCGIDLTKYEIEKCEKDAYVPPAPRHKCKFDDLTLQQIYHKLDDYYIKIYGKRGDDRKVVKNQVISDVELLYKCCTDPLCRQHAASWRQGGEFKDRIIDRYNRIKNF